MKPFLAHALKYKIITVGIKKDVECKKELDVYLYDIRNRIVNIVRIYVAMYNFIYATHPFAKYINTGIYVQMVLDFCFKGLILCEGRGLVLLPLRFSH